MEHVQCSLFIYQPYGRSGVNMRHVAWNIHKHKYTITCVFVCLNIDSKQSHYWLIITPKIKLTWNGNRLSIVSCAVLYVEYICGLFENRSPNSFETDIITIPKYTVENVQFLWMAKNRVDFWSSKFMLNLSNSMVGRSSHHKVQVCTQQNSRKLVLYVNSKHYICVKVASGFRSDSLMLTHAYIRKNFRNCFAMVQNVTSD